MPPAPIPMPGDSNTGRGIPSLWIVYFTGTTGQYDFIKLIK
jgi:hypothetical protein